jgi:pyruvate formate lyase activating enzyme
MKAVCPVCPHHCALEEGMRGLCRARVARGGEVVCANYGILSALALDPIEKKPLARFHPGSRILSMGSFGCNFKCGFCQNHDIAQSDGMDLPLRKDTPEQLVQSALALRQQGNIGLAYTYNEPLVGYEFVRDCAKLAHERGLLNVVVTNGYICEEPLIKLLPYIDAMNIDLKAFSERFYHSIGGDLETVRNSIALSAQHCHVEVTTLVIPGENDAEEEMHALAAWLAFVNPEIPLHISRFFPRHKMRDKSPTPVQTVYRLAQIAREHVSYVYTGNC